MLKLSKSKICSLGFIALLAGACGQPGASNPGSTGPINGTWRAQTVASGGYSIADASVTQISLNIQNSNGSLTQTSNGCTSTVPLSFTFNGNQVSVKQSSSSTTSPQNCSVTSASFNSLFSILSNSSSFTSSGSSLRFSAPSGSNYVSFTK